MEQVAARPVECAFELVRDAWDEWDNGEWAELDIVFDGFRVKRKFGEKVGLLMLLLLLVLLLLLLLLLFLLFGHGFVRVGYLFKFFSIVSVVLVYVDGKLYFFFNLCGGSADAGGAADFAFE
jgi:hypothetical protein